jgi:hypothetical protein
MTGAARQAKLRIEIIATLVVEFVYDLSDIPARAAILKARRRRVRNCLSIRSKMEWSG